MRHIPFYRLQLLQEVSVREMFGLQPHENIKRIIITVHEDSAENAKVKCTLGNESDSKIITKEFAYFYGFDHLVNDNSNCNEKLDCTIQSLSTDCAVSITINLW